MSKSACSKLLTLRKLIQQRQVACYVLRTCDNHGSEFLADRDKRVEYLTSFTGSNALVVVSEKEALLWTDGRYFDQATNQLSSEWTLMKSGMSGVLTVSEWLSNLPEQSAVGFDSRLMTIAEYDKLKSAKIDMKPLVGNLIDEMWDADAEHKRPSYPKDKLFILQSPGLSCAEKLRQVRDGLSDKQVLIISALDEVAWLLNLRGNDIPYTPVFMSFMLIDIERAFVYVEKEKVTCPAIGAHLAESGIEVFEYSQFWSHVNQLPESNKIAVVPKSTSIAIQMACQDKFIVVDPSPVEKLKAVKSPDEQKGFRQAHVKDAVAMCEFLYTLSKSPNSYDELSAESLLDSLRSKQEGYLSPSFRTISGFGPNGATIHYNSTKDTNRQIDQSSLYLVDSGGQYVDGTTDITRTIHLGNPTDHEKKCFTAVLKGYLALANAHFPANASANQLDSIARKPLWDLGLDYMHGTGHGVGFCLCVHEGPFSISPHIANKEPVYLGAVVSDEPGYYETGNFGIRIESLLLCQPSDRVSDYRRFECLTLVPISLNLIDINMLKDGEIDQLNQYHKQVKDTIEPELKRQNKSDEIIAWLNEQTQPLSR